MSVSTAAKIFLQLRRSATTNGDALRERNLLKNEPERGLTLEGALSTYGPMQLGATATSKNAKRGCLNESDILLLSLRILIF